MYSLSREHLEESHLSSSVILKASIIISEVRVHTYCSAFVYFIVHLACLVYMVSLIFSNRERLRCPQN